MSHVKAMEQELKAKTEGHQRAYDDSHKKKNELEHLQGQVSYSAVRTSYRSLTFAFCRTQLMMRNDADGSTNSTLPSAPQAGGDGVLRDAQGNAAHGDHPGAAAGAAGAAAGAGAGAVGAHELSQHQSGAHGAPAGHPAAAPGGPNATSPVQTNNASAQHGGQQSVASPASAASGQGHAGDAAIPQQQQNFAPPPSHPSTAGAGAPGMGSSAGGMAPGQAQGGVPHMGEGQGMQGQQQGQVAGNEGQQIAQAVKNM